MIQFHDMNTFNITKKTYLIYFNVKISFIFQSSWRIGHITQQSQSTGKTESCVYHSGYSYCSRDMFSFYCYTSPNERISCTWTQCTKWCIKIIIIYVWIYWWDGKRLYLCYCSPVGGCFNGQVRVYTDNCFIYLTKGITVKIFSINTKFQVWCQ